MKILFAVSNENVSKRIVDSYQKKYGEAVSFKNVFYFNAIIREIHKDKTYDRIVISEDLEPFASSNYDVIDKFIIERMKQISNEINAQERYIDIVLICTDRRTKAGYVLSKMFEFGIYNALVGQDRRIDNVCTLLNTPRTADEARDYYKIEAQTDTSSIDDVSEQEVQNILMHYKRLGRNEDRYADSFNNIASQYTDKQLKIIIKCLPINVRAVLEAECPKYQELVTYADESEEDRKQKQKIQAQKKIEQIENDRAIKQKLEKQRKESERKAQRNRASQDNLRQVNQSMNSGIDLIDNRRKDGQRMTGNVIIPGNMNIRNERKIYTDEEEDNLQRQERAPRPVSNGSLNPMEVARPVENNRIEPNNLPGFDDFEEPKRLENNVVQPNSLPGFDDFEEQKQLENNRVQPNNLPRFNNFEELKKIDNNNVQTNTSSRHDNFNNIVKQNNNKIKTDINVPIINETENMNKQVNNIENQGVPNQMVDDQKKDMGVAQNVQEQTKRGRGRPRKYPVEPPKPKGKRGRPRKNPLPEEVEQEVPPTIENNIQANMSNISNVPNNNLYSDNNQPINQMPGTEDWNQDSFDTPVNQVNNNQNYDNNNWDSDPFGNNNQPINEMPGTEDWNQDPFDTPVNQVNNNQNYDNRWDSDPFGNNNQQINEMPGTEDWNRDPFEDDNTNNNSSNSNYDKQFSDDLNSSRHDIQPTNYNNYQPTYQNQMADKAVPYSPSQERKDSIQKIEEKKLYSTGSLNTVMTKDKKIVAFVGASKNGTSFLVNNLACLFSSIGVKTAILDMTKNKNSYYIYTDNNENLRNIAYTSIENLENGIAEGIQVDRNLNIYTALPNDNKDYSNAEAILSTLVQNESLVLIDCDFNTDFGYFANAQEIYLVQSMDILTIQPLTAFLRELKTKGLLDEEKLRIVINKELKVKSLTSKAIIGGMSFYIDPAMSYMTDLFNKDKVKACSIPFDENVYAKYIEQTVNCAISISGYNKNFMNSLKILGNMVYPLLSKQTYNTSRNNMEAANYGNNFSNEMNNTLNQMKNKY